MVSNHSGVTSLCPSKEHSVAVGHRTQPRVGLAALRAGHGLPHSAELRSATALRLRTQRNCSPEDYFEMDSKAKAGVSK